MGPAAPQRMDTLALAPTLTVADLSARGTACSLPAGAAAPARAQTLVQVRARTLAPA